MKLRPLFRFILYLLLVWFGIAAVMTLLGSTLGPWKFPPNMDQERLALEKALPAGSSPKKVRTWLLANKVEYWQTERKSRGWQSELEFEPTLPATASASSVIRGYRLNTHRALYGTWSTRYLIFFDQRGRSAKPYLYAQWSE